MTVWTARGRAFPPPGTEMPEWIAGYGAVPYAVMMGGRNARVFFSGRDSANRASIGACTIDLDTLTVDPSSISREPLVAPGAPGTFDESGCSVACVTRDGPRWLLYYTGWMLGRTVPFYLAIGLAVSEDGGVTFRKQSAAPIVDRCDTDPILTASPSVLFDGERWRMWYVSALSWESGRDGLRHRYLIKYAESLDGIRWSRAGHVAIPFENDREYAMGRPHVVKDGGRYRMWFCVRGERYQLACAESDDGLTWERTPLTAPVASDWDNEMQAYPMVLRDDGRLLMFYNGNRYGATGFGVATA